MRFLLVFLVGLVLGCGDDPLSPEESARAALDKRGIVFTANAFIGAAAGGNLEVVQLFVEAGMSVDARYQSGGPSALDGLGSFLEMADVATGGDVGSYESPPQPQKKGRTALHWAARSGHLEVVKFLVGAGASLEAESNDSWTALHFAARWGRLAILKVLVGAGANLEAKNNSGSTALHFAARWGRLAMVKFLVGAGASVKATTNGKTPRALAEDEGHTAVARYLRSVVEEAVEAVRTPEEARAALASLGIDYTERAFVWAVSRKLHSTGGSSSGATEPTRVDAHAP